ncbi:glyceraldehyde-3-phosphate dehydrogenase (NAD+) [Haloarcula quadrata]|jgi:glyceraldehyde 3-phosphate dehydrogenase|uniref:glyceraldehyde-3-phosphate dehydrogenase (NAD(P)(+)) (phosphorylating) n=4 Tax=Haloarcula TaxID=2237 RepID=Q5UZX2_HALMA|nr:MULTISPECIES: type I glyceraldehyde-3-phosphate dehydrogenase [Haloarcula]AAV47181.1 glyceraldehyde 3-phosphate dehydrogenase [Haloarcula marismortui ATCC 43049]EMA15097.1 glyceraldehyde 3-phosphate dehydrogenase [Haloarcula sinaiiensis ATCC 33800]EMA16634.1 glyceraldehyde 3-phosphate dehydrogenase [Haloarcula californiae ATCC 33799]NHN64841.1 type I glyceraldehyde-3-phosphate dehydrogenase [Haloarcula sp. JP-Z28]QCP91883.1 type I glyceraldehyde-3-phosphate dehydrogenase [Haloarcula marismo
MSKPVRVGLNGFGRIGRNVFRASLHNDDVEIVGINDVMDDSEIDYFAQYDTVMGELEGASVDDGVLTVEGTDFEAGIFHETDPTQLPWEDLDVDVAFEATGIFRTKEDASQHLDAGADKVLISAPPKGDEPVKQLVYGVNHDEYEGEDVVSNASCTTNSITPVAKVLDEEFGINAGQLTTVHAYTGSQNLMDGPNGKPRRRRAAAENIIPTSTGAAQAATEVLPELEGKLDGMAIRVPVPNGSITEFVVDLDDDVTESDVNAAFEEAAAGDLEGVLGVTSDDVVSSDILGDPYSTQVDLQSTNVVSGMTKILTWYDNEYGFSNRMLDVAEYITE